MRGWKWDRRGGRGGGANGGRGRRGRRGVVRSRKGRRGRGGDLRRARRGARGAGEGLGVIRGERTTNIFGQFLEKRSGAFGMFLQNSVMKYLKNSRKNSLQTS